MPFKPRKHLRKIHHWVSIIIAIPFLIVLLSGLLLQVKKQFDWIQPPSQKGSGPPTLSFDRILDIAQSVPEAKIEGWKDIDRLDVRPDDGIIKIRAYNHWETQIDARTGEVLQVAYRRSDIIEALHDGSWFHDHAKLLIFLPSALIVTVLFGTGLYLFFLPYTARRKNRRRMEKRKRRRRQE